MKRFFTIFFILTLGLQAGVRVDDSFEKMSLIFGKNLNKKSYKVLSKMTVAGATHSFSSTHFTVYWGDNIPYTTTWADYNSNGTPDFPEDVASILENVWQKEIEELKFHKPFDDHINVYIGNTGIWIDGEELKVGENTCGYAIYHNGDEYIVVNDYLPTSLYTKPKDILKITLAHEFFHLLQYTYSCLLYTSPSPRD